MELSWRAHFSKIGWSPMRSNFEMLYFPETLEAFEINSKNINFEVKVYYENRDDYIEGIEGNLIGTVGESKAIHAISVKCKNTEKSIYYRCCFEHIGWSYFCKDGAICGFFYEMKSAIHGIQIFLSDDNELEDNTKIANEYLDNYMCISENLFINNKYKMLMHLTKNYRDETQAKIKKVANGIILPLKVMKEVKVRNAAYLGGVVDCNGKFIAGHERKERKNVNLSCLAGYEISEYKRIHERVIYGGILFGFFGHLLTESMARLWYTFDKNYKIAMLLAPNAGNVNMEILGLLGIKDRILIVQEPTQFDEVIVPDQSLRLHTDFKIEHKVPYDRIIDKVPKMNYDKIYLTRSHLKKSDGINEEYFEKFFRKRGYVVIAPEEYSLEEQVGMLNSAKDVICTMGTLSHLCLFCKEGTNLTILRRYDNSMLLPQTLINQLKNLNVYYVDATYNFLPTQHSGGVFLYGPTKYFRNYLDKRNFEYDEEELFFDLKEYAYEYIVKWRTNYLNVKNFNEIADRDMVDVINSISRALGEPEISRKKYISKLK